MRSVINHFTEDTDDVILRLAFLGFCSLSIHFYSIRNRMFRKMRIFVSHGGVDILSCD